ncbi:MAG: hypothetical protein R2682_15580 [Pyrinomonadaceae bacterium]
MGEIGGVSSKMPVLTDTDHLLGQPPVIIGGVLETWNARLPCLAFEKVIAQIR